MIDEEYYEEDESPRQPPLYLLTGLVIGILIGLLVSLVIAPVQVVDTSPFLLGETEKDAYRLLIARAYQANGNLERARLRLALLRDDQPPQALADQALRLQAGGASEQDIRALAELAAALSAPQSAAEGEPAGLPTPQPPAGSEGLATPQTFPTLDLNQAVQTATSPPTPTSPPPTPRPTFTPRVQPSPLPTLGAPFELAEQTTVCDANQPQPRLMIEVQDSAGKPVPGIAITVAWDGGIETFYTGLMPSISLGYADFDMQAGVVYSLRVGELSETINGLQAPTCGEGNAAFAGSLRLLFRQR
jgi:hypothetical protein